MRFGILLFIGLLPLIGFAQPVLTFQTHAPAIGDVYNYQFFDTLHAQPGGGGANQIWDFSNIIILPKQTSYKFQDTLGFNYPYKAASYNKFKPDIFLVIDSCSANGYKVTVDSVITLGKFNKCDTIHWYTPTYPEQPYPIESQMKFPFGFKSAKYCKYSDISTYDTADGYGTLLLPNGGKIENLLRVRRTSSKCIYGSVGSSVCFDTQTYNYYSPFDKLPVLIINMTKTRHIYPPPEPWKKTAMVNLNYAVGISPELQKARQVFTIIPNPSLGSFAVKTTGVVARVEIMNLLGDVVYKAEKYTAGEFIQPNLPQGCYVVTCIYQQGEKFSQKLVIAE